MASNFSTIKATLPELGIGLGLRRDLVVETLSYEQQIDFLEITPENYMHIGGAARERLSLSLNRFPVVSHGINLSIGSTDDLNYDYLRSLKKLLTDIKAPWWSDHLCFSSIDGVYMQDLLPLPFTKEAVKHIVKRVKIVQDLIERPFLLENISFYMQMPYSEMEETDFMAEILEQADCGLLLDVNNVFVNSINLKFDPYQYLNRLPLERAVQIHVAGHKKIGDYIIDTHGAPVIEPVYELLDYVLQRTSVKAVMLERDQNFPAFEELLKELKQLRQIANKHGAFLNNKPGAHQEAATQKVLPLDMLKNKRGRETRAISA